MDADGRRQTRLIEARSSWRCRCRPGRRTARSSRSPAGTGSSAARSATSMSGSRTRTGRSSRRWPMATAGNGCPAGARTAPRSRTPNESAGWAVDVDGSAGPRRGSARTGLRDRRLPGRGRKPTSGSSAVAGGSPTAITQAAGDDRSGSWSPDGSRLAFDATRDGNTEIYVVEVDGSNPVRTHRRTRRGLGSGLVAGRPPDRVRVRSDRDCPDLRDEPRRR